MYACKFDRAIPKRVNVSISIHQSVKLGQQTLQEGYVRSGVVNVNSWDIFSKALAGNFPVGVKRAAKLF